MREVFADFADLGDWPGIGLSVALGRADMSPDLATLTDGERILLVEPGELRAEATARLVERVGFHYWFGVFSSRDVIERLDTGHAE